jgi:hypothetical protein
MKINHGILLLHVCFYSFFLINVISNTCIFISGPFHDVYSASGTSC